MSEEEINSKWEEGSVVLMEMSPYIKNGNGVAEYSNAVKVLELLDKFDAIKAEYKKMLKEANIKDSTETISVPDFEEMEKYLAGLRKSCNSVKMLFC